MFDKQVFTVKIKGLTEITQVIKRLTYRITDLT